MLLADGHWARLAPLFATAAGVDRVLDDATDVDALRAPPRSRVGIRSLPFLLDLLPGMLPARMPYLAAPRDRLAAWRVRLPETAGLRVGLAWNARGDRGAPARHKSAPPAMLAQVLGVPGASSPS